MGAADQIDQTGSWKWVAITFAYALAYTANFATDNIAVAFGTGRVAR